MDKEMKKAHQEVSQCFDIMTLPKTPLQMHPGKESESWELCDADGVTLFTLMPGKEMTTVAELAGTRFVLENCITWLRYLVKFIEVQKNVIYSLEDNVTEMKRESLQSFTNIEDSFKLCRDAINSLDDE